MKLSPGEEGDAEDGAGGKFSNLSLNSFALVSRLAAALARLA